QTTVATSGQLGESAVSKSEKARAVGGSPQCGERTERFLAPQRPPTVAIGLRDPQLAQHQLLRPAVVLAVSDEDDAQRARLLNQASGGDRFVIGMRRDDDHALERQLHQNSRSRRWNG